MKDVNDIGADDAQAQEHYFTAQPAGADVRRDITVDIWGVTRTVETAPGVFCPERLDLGTSVLLREVPEPPQIGDVLDLGCGWGPISIALATAAPKARVWGVDVNMRALDLLERNAARLGLTGITAALPGDVPDDVRFSTIWSNPPIRVGKEVLHTMLLTWLPRLVDGGAAYLVVQKNLGADSLHAWLGGTLGPLYTVSRLASAKGFRVLEVRRHREPQLDLA